MLDHHFLQSGYCYIPGRYYLSNNNKPSLYDVKKMFDLYLTPDNAQRKRAYLKLEWSREKNIIEIANNQNYFQSAQFNNTDGGKIRQFSSMNKQILNIPIVQELIEKNIHLIKNYTELAHHDKLTFGMHFIRYEVDETCASNSSPPWLHKDDEPLVFIHLINLSKNALGGDNLIADNESKEVMRVIRLEEDLETLVVNKNVYHAVTPLGSRKQIANRDVILFTIEPQYTQIVN